MQEMSVLDSNRLIELGNVDARIEKSILASGQTRLLIEQRRLPLCGRYDMVDGADVPCVLGCAAIGEPMRRFRR